MDIEFWGVRGSIPTPSTANFSTTRYGGNTTCVSVTAPGIRIVLDAGSGLRALGLGLLDHPNLRAAFFFSHYHWDHIQGFPFFMPAFVKGNSFELYGPHFVANPPGMLERVLSSQQQSFNFPVQLSEIPAALNFHDAKEWQQIELSGTESRIVVTPGALKHPGGCFGYRIEEFRKESSRSFVYATDHEHSAEVHPALQALAKGADILFYDAQYTPDEYAGFGGCRHAGWGHSTYAAGIKEAVGAGVRRLLLTHHDPLHDDWAIARLESAAAAAGRDAGIEVSAAREGMKIVL